MCRKSKVIDKEKEEILWGNSAFKINGFPLFLKHWAANVGTTHTSDIIKDKELGEYGIYEKLIHKASFFFDIRKVKAALSDSWNNKSTDENNNASPQRLLDMLFIIPGGDKKGTWEICHKRTLTIFSFWITNLFWNPNPTGKNKLHDDYIAWDMWFKQNLCNNLMPKKCKDFNWKLLRGQITQRTVFVKCNILMDHVKFVQTLLNNVQWCL